MNPLHTSGQPSLSGSGDEHPDINLADFFSGSTITVLSQTDAGLHLRNNATGDILLVGAEIGHDLESGADVSWLELQLNGRSLPGDLPDSPASQAELPPPWKRWQPDDDPRGSCYTLDIWPLTLIIDPHENEVLLHLLDRDQPLARRAGFKSLAEAQQIALKLAANVLTDWQLNIQQALLLHETAAAADTPEMKAWHFEQYGDTDDPTEGYYTHHLGPFQLVAEPNTLDANINILDPDFQVIRTGLTSVDEARRVAGDLLADALAGWQNELKEWQMTDVYSETHFTLTWPAAACDWALRFKAALDQAANDEVAAVTDQDWHPLLQRFDDDPPRVGFELARSDVGLKVSAPGFLCAESLAIFIQIVLRRFNALPPVRFEWADYSGNKTPDTFGGGACVIGRHKIVMMTTADWLAALPDTFLAEPEV